MCGRFALYTPPARIARYFDATLAEGEDGEHQASWNVAPTDQVLGVRDRPQKDGGEPVRTVMTFRWGLIPWWSKDAKSGSRLFNARCETAATRASFREAFRERRIIVPADGFYEWRRLKTGGKVPNYFTRADGAPLAFAGLAERWRDKAAPEGTPPVRSCTIITAPGGADMHGIHDRMPVILDPSTFDLWLDPANEDVEGLRALMRPPPEGTVVHHTVGPRVGNVKNNDPSLIEDGVSPGRFDRRTLLRAALATGGAAVLAAAERGDAARAGAALTRAAASTKAAGSDLGAVQHVVFLMKENRSFDHYFGTYRGVRGFDDHPAGDLGVFAQRWPGGRERTLLPFHLDSSSAMGECTTDLDHSWRGEHLSRGPGDNSAFVATHVRPEFEGPEQGVLTMGYYTRRDLPFYYALADAFTLCDNYHCSVLGPTHPNRLMSLSGTIDPAGRAGGPVLETNSSPDAVYSAHWDTMPEVLEDAGVSWKVYTPTGEIYEPTFVAQHGMGTTDAILPYFSQYKNPTSALYRKAFLPTYPNDFVADIASGSLPAVSWLLPPAGYDEHPSSPPALGEYFTNQVLSALVSNPSVWSKTVLFHMYDENDGFFDHVAPPVAPKGTAGEYLAGALPADAHGVRGPVGLGFRVPMLVLSPFARGGHIASQVFDHTSQLRFLEQRFGVRAPNISAWRRRTVGDLTSALPALRGGGNASVPVLPSTAGDQMADMTALGCSSAAVYEIATDLPAYPVPEHQSMPHQESAT